MKQQDFESLVREAERQPFSGWDFSYIAKRYSEQTLSWDYRSIVQVRMKGVGSMLDLGTGGGEFLASLGPLPAATFATEAYQPNVAVARRRLEPLGVKVVQIEREDDLKLPSRFFDLVVDRHESFDAEEVSRVLKPGQPFITQQVGPQNNKEIRELFGAAGETSWTIETGSSELRKAGFRIHHAKDELGKAAFTDVGALVYYLKAIPWEVPGFSVERHKRLLREVHARIQAEGKFEVTNQHSLIEAESPAD